MTPALVGLIVLLLSALAINQSSIALLGPSPESDPGMLVPVSPRVVRYDEYVRSTPAIVGNVRKGLPTSVWLGLSPIGLDATSLGAPTRSWTMAFRPQLLPLALAGSTNTPALERGFAFRWWATVAVGILGVYALLLALRRRPLLAAVLALAVGLSPLVPWWSGADLSLVVGFTAGAGAALLMAARSSLWWRGALWALLSSWLAIAAFLVLYPPWLICTALVVGPVVVGALWDRRAPLARALPAFAVVALATASAIALWLADNRAAVAAIAATDYPGGRRAQSAEGVWAALMSAPTSIVTSLRPQWSLREVGGQPMNLSEQSSGWISGSVAVLLVALLAVSIARQRRSPRPASRDDADDRWHGAALGAIIGSVILAAWALVPLPALVGAGLLERVPGVRTYIGIALGFAVLVHVGASRVRLARGWTIAVCAGVLVAAALQGVRVATDLLTPGRTGALVTVGMSLLLAGGLLGVILGGRTAARASSLLLAAIVVVTYAVALPPYRGLGPLTDTPLARYLATMAAREGPSRWVSFEPTVEPVIAGSAHALLSGMTYYPDADVWSRLAPSQRAQWNNFRTYRWEQDPSAAPAAIDDVAGNTARLRVDLCSTELGFLDIRYAVTSVAHPAVLPCFTPVDTIQDAGTTLTIWRRTSGG